MIIDGREAILGSQNLDFFSFELNSEIGVFFKEAETVGKLESIVAKWKKQSRPFLPAQFKLSFFEKILAHFLNFFVRLI